MDSEKKGYRKTKDNKDEIRKTHSRTMEDIFDEP